MAKRWNRAILQDGGEDAPPSSSGGDAELRSDAGGTLSAEHRSDGGLELQWLDLGSDPWDEARAELWLRPDALALYGSIKRYCDRGDEVVDRRAAHLQLVCDPWCDAVDELWSRTDALHLLGLATGEIAVDDKGVRRDAKGVRRDAEGVERNAKELQEQGLMQSQGVVPLEALKAVGVLGCGAFGTVTLQRDTRHGTAGKLFALEALSKGYRTRCRCSTAPFLFVCTRHIVMSSTCAS